MVVTASQQRVDVPILIVGAGPVGLAHSIELSRYGVPHLVLGRDMATSAHPRANAINARSMEHYRRLGLSKTIRKSGLPLDHPSDIVYVTRLDGLEITRVPIPSRGEAIQALERGDTMGWPTPELPHILSQIYLEEILLDAAEEHSSAEIRLGWQVISLVEYEDSVEVVAENLHTGEQHRITTSWLVGADGASSTIRSLIGAKLEGGRAERVFLGGSTIAVYFESPELQSMLAGREARMYLIFNPEQRGGGFAINGTDRFVFHVQAPPGTDPQTIDERPLIAGLVGHDFEYKLLSRLVWNAGLSLVADKLSSRRIFLAGDAAHLFTPTGGFGMNTGLDEAANLSWKLAAMVQGWGGASLPSTYNFERRPIAIRNVNAAARIADLLMAIPMPPDIERESGVGEAARAETADRIQAAVKEEAMTFGIQFGVRYEGSPIVLPDGTAPTPDIPTEYIPVARPGSRLPHVALAGGSIYDELGTGFTLLCIGIPETSATDAYTPSELKAPLIVRRIDHDGLAELYEARYVLVRPDQHVAWRGQEMPDDFSAILERACGFGLGETSDPAASGPQSDKLTVQTTNVYS